ncbi:MAG: NAD(P)H-binding protein [Ferruginibacter sp.]
MKIIITGSLGHISKPLAESLIQKGHSITVISSKAEKEKDIEALGARAAIGSVEDVSFLTKTFTGADIVYLMEPPVNFLDHTTNVETQWANIAQNYLQAIQQSGVTKVVHLSSIGAHTDKNNGMLAAHYLVENILKQLPENVSIKFMRPVGFYYNMFAFIHSIKTQSAIIQNYGGDEKEPWVSPSDIAAVIAEEMEKPFSGREVRYIASDEVSPNEVAKILGEAVGKPDLQWRVIPDETFQNGLIAAGFSTSNAKGLTEMNAGRRAGVLYEDYHRHQPTLSKTKLTDFVKEFAIAYSKS